MNLNLNRGISTPLSITIIVVIGALAIGSILAYEYYYVPKEEPIVQEPVDSETADWKTYTNEEYGFEAKYPKTWIFGEESNYVSFMSVKGQDTDLLISVIDKSIDEAEKLLPIFDIKNREINSRENLTVNGIEWTKLIVDTNQVIQLTHKNGKTYVIQYANFPNFGKESETIFQSFKFIDSTISTKVPSFIKSLNNTKDVKIDFRYESDYPCENLGDPEFYTLGGSDEKFLSLSKVKDKEGKYLYGPDYYSIFSSEGSHWYGGTPIYLFNPKSEYSISYIGFKIDNRELISEMKLELGTDFLTGRDCDSLRGQNLDERKFSILNFIFGIETVYACGPGRYARFVGDSGLIFIEESDGIAWYRLEKPINLYNLPLKYCDKDCSSMPDYCQNQADDPEDCWEDYNCCFYGDKTEISDYKEGNLRMHILYKPNDKEGFLKLQVANLILSDPLGNYYQPIMGENFDHYYRAYFR